MKTNRVGFIVLLLIAFLNFSCAFEEGSEEKPADSPCDECVFGKPGIVKPEKTDMSFKVDITENDYFQPFQLDLKHSFGILGRLDKIENDTLKTVSFSMLDIGECDRYKIVDARWENMVESDSVDYEHYLLFNIEKVTPTEKERVVTYTPNVPISLNEVIRVGIISKTDPRINLPRTGPGNNYTYIFPPFNCPIKLIKPSE